MTSEANDKPQPKGKQQPWIPPRFETVDMELTGLGHTYYDHDDATSPGGGRGQAQNKNVKPFGADQDNPYNS